MGGARPKMLLDIDGHEWIAKFPKGDVVDMPLVEHATMKLALTIGIRAAKTDVIEIDAGHVLLVKRFDRDSSRRIHSLSARSILAKTTRPSYASMAETLRAKSAFEQMGMRRREVFSRLVFNVLMDNTDDHEKNHAFFMAETGVWDLSDAYDLLPQMDGAGGRGLPIGRRQGANHFVTAIENHQSFGVTREEAIDEWFRVADIVSNWKVFSPNVASQEQTSTTLRTSWTPQRCYPYDHLLLNRHYLHPQTPLEEQPSLVTTCQICNKHRKHYGCYSRIGSNEIVLAKLAPRGKC